MAKLKLVKFVLTQKQAEMLMDISEHGSRVQAGIMRSKGEDTGDFEIEMKKLANVIEGAWHDAGYCPNEVCEFTNQKMAGLIYEQREE